MKALLFGLIMLLVALGASKDALACSCERINQNNAAEWISRFEIIVDGVVTERDPLAREGNTEFMKTARLHITRIWKGLLPPEITLQFDEHGVSCGAPPPVGRPIRITLGFSGSDTPWTFNYGLCSDLLDDPKFDRPLAEYSARTEAMMRNADQGRDGLLELARYLQWSHESLRAKAIYAALLRDDPGDVEAMLGKAVALRAMHKETESLALLAEARTLVQTGAEQGWLARATFQITGQTDPAWKDWSHLENYGYACEISQADLNGVSFDDARLMACRFKETPLKGASFRGADLTYTNLNDDQTVGAFYDCRTRFQRRFDPQAAGMINVEGTCSEKPSGLPAK
jgi:hypothetical protein